MCSQVNNDRRRSNRGGRGRGGRRAGGQSGGATKPRNPRHFDGIKGGRKRVSGTLLTKTVFDALRGAEPLFHTYTFWRQNTVRDTFEPRLY